MMTPDELTTGCERIAAFCRANGIEELVGMSYNSMGPSVHLRMEDFARVFRGASVNVSTVSGYDHLIAECEGFAAITMRPMPMVLGPRIEVMS